MKFSSLVLSGGGLRGISELGALSSLWGKELIWDDIKEVAGVSIGSVISLLLLSGLTPDQIHMRLCEIDSPFGKILSFKAIKKGWGLLSLKSFKREIIKIGGEELREMTFHQLFLKTEKSLKILATNLSSVSSEVFSKETTPHLRCIDAVLISCNLPFLFSRIKYKGHYFIDGGFSNNLPLSIVSGNVLAIWIRWEYPIFGEISLIDYLSRISTVTMSSIIKREIETNNDRLGLVIVNCISDAFFEMIISEESKVKLFTRGVDAVGDFRFKSF